MTKEKKKEASKAEGVELLLISHHRLWGEISAMREERSEKNEKKKRASRLAGGVWAQALERTR